ncbi:MAG: hypothetical protein V4608_10285 [Bacteroidota bacterium]
MIPKTDNAISKANNKDTSSSTFKNAAAAFETETLDNPNFYNIVPDGPGVQTIKNILKENADCTHPILIYDSILFSPYSPNGSGNIIEMPNNKPLKNRQFSKTSKIFFENNCRFLSLYRNIAILKYYNGGN